MEAVKKRPRMGLIAGVILDAADAGEFLCVKEVHERLPYDVVYGTLRKQMKFFEDKGWIVKQRAGSSVLIKPTPLLYTRFRR